jgi:hypothetical protein
VVPTGEPPRSPRTRRRSRCRAQASNLVLDARAVPRPARASAKDAWDQVRPEGTVDVDLSYSGAPTDGDHPAAPEPVPRRSPGRPALPQPPATLAPSTAPRVPSGFDLLIKPASSR